jgi:hypothetical protein
VCVVFVIKEKNKRGCVYNKTQQQKHKQQQKHPIKIKLKGFNATITKTITTHNAD